MPIVIYLLGYTWKVKYVGKEHEDEVGSPLIWAFWHSRLLPLVFFYRKQDIYVLVSRSTDGEIISRVLNSMGFRTIRGSSSRGGMASLREIIEKLKQPIRVAFTPDGPTGPPEEVKIGVVAASKKSNVPIIPVATSANRMWKLKSWDKFLIPKPFATIEIRMGKPIYPGKKDLRQISDEVQRRMDDITKKADLSMLGK